MPRISKPPEERKQELIDVASKLFFQKGYDQTSVRDILKEVDGAPGMFYYYFKSKDDIYQEVMQQHINKYLSCLTDIYSNSELPIPVRITMVIKKIHETFMRSLGAIDKSDSPDNQGFLMSIKEQILNSNVEPIKHLLDEAIESGFLKIETLQIEDTKSYALFIIYGTYGLLNGENITKLSFETAEERFLQIPLFISKLLGIPLDTLLIEGQY